MCSNEQLEPGEIDEKRAKEFEKCFRVQELKEKESASQSEL